MFLYTSHAAYEVGTDIDKKMTLGTLELGGTQFGFRRNLAKSSGKMSLGTLEPSGTQSGFRRNLAKTPEICGFALNGTWRNPIRVPQEPS